MHLFTYQEFLATKLTLHTGVLNLHCVTCVLSKKCLKSQTNRKKSLCGHTTLKDIHPLCL